MRRMLKNSTILAAATVALLIFNSCKSGQTAVQTGEKAQTEETAETEIASSTPLERKSVEAKPSKREELRMELKNTRMQEAEGVLQKAAAKSAEADKGDLQ